MCRQIISPRPVLCGLSISVSPACWKRSKIFLWSFGDADAIIAHVDAQRARLCPRHDGDQKSGAEPWQSAEPRRDLCVWNPEGNTLELRPPPITSIA